MGVWIQPVPREMLPSLSTAAQEATVAQEIAVKPLNTLAGWGSAAMGADQMREYSVTTFPLMSAATQKAADVQETEVTPAEFSTPAGPVQPELV